MKRYLLSLFPLFLIFSCLLAQNKYVNGFNLNFRSTPGIEQNNIMGVIPHGKAVTEIGRPDTIWSKVIYNHKAGYVVSKFLSDQKPAAPAQKEMARPVQKKEAMVLICVSRSAYAYHSHRCYGLNRCTHTISKVSLTQAKNSGYRACKICY